MKKITYLVAPLMVMPFLLGCNKVTTHKVDGIVTTANSLTFTTMNGKELDGSSFNEKQDFKFKVTANNTQGTTGLTVVPDGIGIYVGQKSSYPLLDGYTVQYTKDDCTEAVVTIGAEYTTADIHIRAIAAKADNFIYYAAVLAGVEVPKGQEVLNWAPISAGATINFNVTEGHTKPEDDDFLFLADGEFKTVGDDFATVNDGKLTIQPDAVKDYVLISAKAHDYNYLNSFSWDEIKEASVKKYAPLLFNIGDTKKIKTTDGVEYDARIIGFDHDMNKDGEIAGITFQFVQAISNENGEGISTVWNKEASSIYYPKSSLNDAINGSMVFNKLPEDLKNNIMEVRKYVGTHQSSSWELGYCDTKLFPLAHAEMSANPSRYDVDKEGTIYAYYTDHQTTEGRKVLDVKENACKYWLRSPRTGFTTLAWAITESGAFDTDGQRVNEIDHAVVPAFCI